MIKIIDAFKKEIPRAEFLKVLGFKKEPTQKQSPPIDTTAKNPLIKKTKMDFELKFSPDEEKLIGKIEAGLLPPFSTLEEYIVYLDALADLSNNLQNAHAHTFNQLKREFNKIDSAYNLQIDRGIFDIAEMEKLLKEREKYLNEIKDQAPLQKFFSTIGPKLIETVTEAAQHFKKRITLEREHITLQPAYQFLKQVQDGKQLTQEDEELVVSPKPIYEESAELAAILQTCLKILIINNMMVLKHLDEKLKETNNQSAYALAKKAVLDKHHRQCNAIIDICDKNSGIEQFKVLRGSVNRLLGNIGLELDRFVYVGDEMTAEPGLLPQTAIQFNEISSSYQQRFFLTVRKPLVSESDRTSASNQLKRRRSNESESISIPYAPNPDDFTDVFAKKIKPGV